MQDPRQKAHPVDAANGAIGFNGIGMGFGAIAFMLIKPI